VQVSCAHCSRQNQRLVQPQRVFESTIHKEVLHWSSSPQEVDSGESLCQLSLAWSGMLDVNVTSLVSFADGLWYWVCNVVTRVVEWDADRCSGCNRRNKAILDRRVRVTCWLSQHSCDWTLLQTRTLRHYGILRENRLRQIRLQQYITAACFLARSNVLVSTSGNGPTWYS